MQPSDPSRHPRTNKAERGGFLCKQIELLDSEAADEDSGGRSPHLEPSSLLFLSNSVETLGRVRRSDSEEGKRRRRKKKRCGLCTINIFRSIPVNEKNKTEIK